MKFGRLSKIFRDPVPKITFGKLHEDVKIPSKRREDAGLDIYAYFDEEG